MPHYTCRTNPLHTITRLVCLFVFLAGSTLLGGILAPRSSYAQLPERLSPSAHVEILTMAPGTAVHAVFGHSALRVVDPELGLDAVFNFGTFDPTDPFFVPKFAYGDMQYFVSAAPGRAVVEAYAAEGRSVYAQHIRMTPEHVAALYAALRTNLEPENRTYLYDFVRDNCSTRLIDLLSLYAGVQLPGAQMPGAQLPGAEPDPRHAAQPSQQPTSQQPAAQPSFRELIRSYLGPHPWLDLGINLILSAPMERVPSPRERTFLPFELMAALEAATVPAPADSAVGATRLPADSAVGATRRPAVLRTDTLFAGRIHGPSLARAPARLDKGGSARPRFVWPFRLAALLLAVFALLPARFATLPRRARPSTGEQPSTGAQPSRRAEYTDRALLWTTGIIGLILLFMWLGTQHTVTSWNTNLLWAFPLNIFLARRTAVRPLSAVATALCAVAALTPILPLQTVPAALWPFTILLTVLHVRRAWPLTALRTQRARHRP